MKKSRAKLVASVLSIALLATAGTVITQKSKTTEVSAVTEAKTGVTASALSTPEVVNLAATNVTTQSLTIDALRNKALTIIPGTIVKTEYDYDLGKQIVSFDIVDKNGIKREIELEASTGKVYDIDYDYDANGNRFINQGLFEVNKTYEQAQAIALNRIPGQVLNHKQDVERGLFVYEFIIKGNNGFIYEVDVETKTGAIIKIEIDDDYNPYKYNLGPVVLPNTNTSAGITTNTTTNTTTTTTTPNVTAPTTYSEATLRQKVLGKFPGTVIKFEQDYDDGMMEYEYKIRQANGAVVKVEINQFGYITDVDY